LLVFAWGIVMSFLGSYLEVKTAFYFFGAQAFIACVCSVLLKQKLKRVEMEAAAKAGALDVSQLKVELEVSKEDNQAAI